VPPDQQSDFELETEMTHHTTFTHNARRFLAMVLFGAICVTALTAAAARAAAVHINCPVDQIRREIT
jgi:hypothetical protein